jgi:hypothetical protein
MRIVDCVSLRFRKLFQQGVNKYIEYEWGQRVPLFHAPPQF